MITILIYFFMGIGLSMDTFSVSLSLGTLSLSQKEKNVLSITVGIFHFIMPLLGNVIGNQIYQPFFPYTKYLAAFLFFFLSCEMMFSKKKTENYFSSSLLTFLGIAFTVSMDSFTVGVLLGMEKSSMIIPCILFSTLSFLFTEFGLWMGKELKKHYESKAEKLGSILLFLIGLKYLLWG